MGVRGIRLGSIPERGFDFVTVEIAYEATVIGIAVLRSRSRLTVRDGTGRDRGSKERIDFLRTRCREANVRAVANGGRLAVDWRLEPELRKRFAVRHRAGYVHEWFSADQRHQHVIELFCTFEVVRAEGDMRNDTGVIHKHPADFSGPLPRC